MTTDRELTQSEIDECQRAGNDAYVAIFVVARWNLYSAAVAYRKAYDAKRDEILSRDEIHPGYIVAQAVTLPEAQTQAAEQHAQFTDWRAGERGQGYAGNEPETCEAGGFG